MFENDFRVLLIREHNAAVESAARQRLALHPPTAPRTVVDETVALRLCRVGDDPALLALAELEGKPEPTGRFVIVEVNGTIVAAQPLDGGAPLADPFRRTEHLLPLLQLRVSQLAAPTSRESRRRWLPGRRAIAPRV